MMSESEGQTYYNTARFDDLIGKIMVEVSVNEDKDVMRFVNNNGFVFEFYHEQECCEDVRILDIIGELDDLVGAPIYMAEMVVDEQHNPDDVKVPDYQGSFTWTFYKFGTRKGYVTIRWYGESNGYYSESVDVRSYYLVPLQ